MKVNLLPEERRKQGVRVNWLRIFITIVSIILIFFLGGSYYINTQRVKILETEVDVLNRQIQYYRPLQHDYQDLQARIKELQKDDQLNWEKYTLAGGLQELRYSVPGKLTINSLIVKQDRVTMHGLAETSNQILTLADRLSVSDYYSQVDLVNMTERSELNFEIDARLAGEGG